MTTKGICHHVRLPRFIPEGEVKLGKKILPSRLLQSEFLLGGEAARRHVVGEDGEVGAEEVVALCPQIVDHGDHLLLVHQIPLFGVAKLPTFEGNRVTFLCQDAANAAVRCIGVHLEGERKIWETED